MTQLQKAISQSKIQFLKKQKEKKATLTIIGSVILKG